MSYDSDETSVESGLPQELYTITTPTTVYRLTSSEQDVTWSSNVYEADVVSRGSVAPANMNEARELTISLPLDHDVAQSLLASGIPEQNISFVLARIHPTASSAREQWRGFVDGVSTDDQYLRLRVMRDITNALAVQLPIAKGSRLCQHMLFDAGCKLDRTFFQALLTVDSVSDTTLTVTWAGTPPDPYWANGGDIVTISGSEKRSVISQSTTTIVVNHPFKTNVVGTSLSISAGCDRSIDDHCRDKFDNVVNFGGHPHLPDNQPTVPNGYGVIVQE